jgi:small GTP-binding protein
MLISSLQIYNISQNIQENDLDVLYTFTEYGRAAFQYCFNNKRPFQHLKFLIRDWQSINEYEYGSEGGNKFIKQYLDVNRKCKEKAQRVRNQISKCFDEISCFLLPHPGSKVATGNYKNLNDFDKEFLEFVIKFMNDLFKPENIIAKEINGSAMNGSEIFEYFVNYIDLFSKEDIPSPISMIEATIRTGYDLAINRSLDAYKSIMGEVEVTGKKNWAKIHDKALRKALNIFVKLPKYGDLEESVANMERLLDEIWDIYEKLENNSEEARAEAKISFEDSMKSAFALYCNHMNEKFGSEAREGLEFFDFDLFHKYDSKSTSQAIELFIANGDKGFDEIRSIYEMQLKEKISSHYKELDRHVRERTKILKGKHESKLEQAKSFYSKKMAEFLNVDDINDLKNDQMITLKHENTLQNAIKEYFDSSSNHPLMTEEFIGKFKEFTDIEIQKIRNEIHLKFSEAERICLLKLDEIEKWYVSEMSQYVSCSELREKHPEVYAKAEIKFHQSVREVNETYKNYSQKFSIVMESNLKTIYDRHLTRGYIYETCIIRFVDQVKIVVIGDKGVGKTDLINRFTKNHFVKVKKSGESVFEATPDILARITTVQNSKAWLGYIRFWDTTRVKIAIWDTHCNNEIRKLPQDYYKNAEGVIIVFDVTKPETLLSLSEWISDANVSNPKAKKLIIANKIDGDRKVETRQIEEYLSAHKLNFREVSSLKGFNVEEAFNFIASQIMSDKKLCTIL